MRREQGIEDWHATTSERLLREIQYTTALGAYYQTDTKKSKPPKPLVLPGDTTQAEKKRPSGRAYDQTWHERQAARTAQLAKQKEAAHASSGIRDLPGSP
jgi:rubrerythrin